MKKRFLSVISTVTAFLMSIVALSGCSLITKDSEREMNTVVATVNNIVEGVEENVYKKDMIMAYMNYGYYYVQYQGYTQERVLNMILDNLVNNRILVQNALKIEGKDSVEDCLSADQKTEAVYNAYKTINDLLDSYETSEDEKKSDTLTETVRTVPDGATNAEDKITIEKKRKYIGDGFDTDSTAERRDAFTKTVKLLKNNGLLGEEYDGKDLTKTTYYKNVIKSYYESELLEAYEKNIKDKARKITKEDLEKEWTKKVDTQKEWSNEEFKSALSSATLNDPIVYSAYGKYGYVYNLLLGVSEEQEAAIAKIKEDEPNITDAEYAEKRNDILMRTTVKDLRSTWITSGYDFDGTKFTGDYTFTKPENSLPFKGTVKELKAKTDDENAQYSVTKVDEYGLEEFIKLIDEYVYGGSQTNVKTTSDAAIYKKVNSSSALDQYAERINELLFAFSTDSGSLNTWKGYNIKPAVDGAATEEYVTTFANAARTLINMDNKSYIIVGSDYGYHVLFYSELYNANETKFVTLESYLDTLGIEKEGDWEQYIADMLSNWDDFEDTDNFLYTFIDSVTSAKVSNALAVEENKVINEYRYERTDCVKTYESRYKDLLG